MDETPKVLLVGSTLTMSPFFAERIRERGCVCQLAACFRDAEALLRGMRFALVLSEMNLPDGSAHPLMARLEGSAATLFFRVHVYHGSWWLPAMDQGKIVWGAPALRPEEFQEALESLLPEAAKPVPAVVRPSTAPIEVSPKTPQRVEPGVLPLRKVSA